MFKKYVMDFDALDDIIDGFDRAKSNLYLRISECKDDIEKEKLIESYLNILKLQTNVTDMIKIIYAKEDENA